MEDLLHYLNGIHPMSENLVAYLSIKLKTRLLTKKEFLLKRGHISRDICFINKGLLRCFYHIDDIEICSWFMKEGDVIISVESFFNQTKSYESIQALDDCIRIILLTMNYNSFIELSQNLILWAVLLLSAIIL